VSRTKVLTEKPSAALPLANPKTPNPKSQIKTCFGSSGYSQGSDSVKGFDFVTLDLELGIWALGFIFASHAFEAETHTAAASEDAAIGPTGQTFHQRRTSRG